ncbi:nucleotide exchange factor GrpE [Candidatus Woesearchaeota archaeon]|nr:nucleotide exchange factor GrpE [Candidatus Woesearchaeota archaeon]
MVDLSSTEQEKTKEEEYLEQLQRLQADFINYRSRVEKEKLSVIDSSKDSILRKFLEVKDNFERIPKADKGIELIYNQLNKIFEQEGVQEIIDMQYNPELHEAIAIVEGEEDAIIEVSRKGYRRNGKVLRPAQIILGKNTKEKHKNE